MWSVIKPHQYKRMMLPQMLSRFNSLFNVQRKHCYASEARYNVKRRTNNQTKTTGRLSITTSCCRQASKDEVSEDDEDEDAIYNRNFVDMKLEDYESLYKDDKTGEIKSTIEATLSEYAYLKYNTMGRVPSCISVEQMSSLLNETNSVNQRENYIRFLFLRENIKIKNLRKKATKAAESLSMRKVRSEELTMKHGPNRTGLLGSSEKLSYGLWHNSLFPRISDSKIRHGESRSRLIQAASFGSKLVFDFDYEDSMSPHVNRGVLDQVQIAYGMNRHLYKDPFDIWFCNLKRGSNSEKHIETKALNSLYDKSLITVKSDCFTNHFDKSRLVYLSPHSEQVMKKVNADDVYIIGVYNDKGGAKQLSYRKAQNLGIRSMRLPLDHHIAWSCGSKSLCVNHVTQILLEVTKNGNDWRAAMMASIPPRKIKSLDQLKLEEERRTSKRIFRLKNKFSLRRESD